MTKDVQFLPLQHGAAINQFSLGYTGKQTGQHYSSLHLRALQNFRTKPVLLYESYGHTFPHTILNSTLKKKSHLLCPNCLAGLHYEQSRTECCTKVYNYCRMKTYTSSCCTCQGPGTSKTDIPWKRVNDTADSKAMSPHSPSVRTQVFFSSPPSGLQVLNPTGAPRFRDYKKDMIDFQAGCDSGQPGLLAGAPAHGRGVETG